MIQPEWKTAKEYEDITYKKCNGVARIAFNRNGIKYQQVFKGFL